jgi:hypothetical protein
MDQDTFTKLVQMLHYLHLGASEVAGIIVAPLLLLGALGGFFSRAGFFAAAYRVAPFELEDRNDANAWQRASKT